MSKGQKELGLLLIHIQEIYGTDAFKKAVNTIPSPPDPKREEVEFTLNIIAEHYQISRRALKYSNARGTIAEARRVACWILHYRLGLTVRYIAKLFDKWPSCVGRFISEFKTLDVKIKVNKEHKDKFDLFTNKLIEFVNGKNNSQE
jgi:hypothetical protein